ncbi:MAG: hypothetical protein ACOCRO_03305, partial [Halanaerobiales bacterium]
MSATTSGQLFMATANPAALVTIGNGVGNTVMGPSGFIAQISFIPVSGGILLAACSIKQLKLLFGNSEVLRN